MKLQIKYLFFLLITLPIFTLAQTPVNDNCDNAISLEIKNTCVMTKGTIKNATTDKHLQDVFYKFVAGPNPIIINILADFDVQLYLYDDCANDKSIASSYAINPAWGNEEVLINDSLTSGKTYYISVSANPFINPSATTFEICIQNTYPPVNDKCDNSISLTPSNSCITSSGTIEGAITDKSRLFYEHNQDVFYKFVATSNSAKINVSSEFMSEVHLYKNCSDGESMDVSSNHLLSGSIGAPTEGKYKRKNKLINNELIKGETYYIAVANYKKQKTTTPNFDICVQNIQPPINDNCDKATLLALTDSCIIHQGNIEGATKEKYNQDVFYKFVADSNQTKISLYSDFYSKLFLYKDCSDTAPIDSISFIYLKSKTLTKKLIEGNTYYISVSSFYKSSSSHEFDICVKSTPNPPVNDKCDNAVLLTLADSCITYKGNIENATKDKYNQDVFFKFVADSSKITINLLADFDAELHLFDSCLSEESIDFSDNDGKETITSTTLVEGKTYYLAVANHQEKTSTPNFDICITTQPKPAPPINDDCANAISLTPTDSCIVYTGSIESATKDQHYQDVFYKFTANSYAISINVETEFDGEVYLYENCTGDTISFANNVGAEKIERITETSLIKGNTYYISIANHKVTTSNPNFRFCLYNPSSYVHLIDEGPILKTLYDENIIDWEKENPGEFYLSQFKALDYDNDKDLDLFTGGSFLINEKGEFSEQMISLKQSNPFAGTNEEVFFAGLYNNAYKVLEIEDVNKDGNLDLFLFNTEKNYIQIYSNINTENKNWFYETPFQLTIENPQKITLLDFDNDGYKDYVVGNHLGFKIYHNSIDFGNEPTILYESTYSGYTQQAGTSDLVAADFNNDGLIDLFNGASFFYRTNTGFTQEDKIKYNIYFLSIKNTTITDYDNNGIVEISGEIDYNKDFVPYTSLTIQSNDIKFHNHHTIENIDYDNDGKLEKIVADNSGLFYDKNIEKNKFYNSDSKTLSFKYSGDIDKNGTSEIFLYDDGYLAQYSFIPDSNNTAPIPPDSITYEIQDQNIVFTWENGKDKETPSELLKYNLIIVPKDTFSLLANARGQNFWWINSFDNDFEIVAKILGIQYNSSSLSGTIISSDLDTSGAILVENIQIANIGNQNTFTLNLEQSVEFSAFEVFLFTVDQGDLVSSNYTYLDKIFPNKFFSLTHESSSASFRDYPQLEFADINSDNKWDVVINERLYGNWSSTPGGDANWISQSQPIINNLPFSTPSNHNYISDFADFNGDGQLDFLAVHNQNNTASIYTKDNNTFSEYYQQKLTQGYVKNNYTVTYQQAIFEDFDSDGDLDCMIGDNDNTPLFRGNDLFRILENDNGKIIQREIDSLNILYFFDYDHNGEKDVICLRNDTREGFTHRIYLELWTRKGSDFKIKQKLMEVDYDFVNNPYGKFETIDIDADGKFELVFHEIDQTKTTVFKQNSFGFYEIQLVKERVSFLDYDNDGLIDYFDFTKNPILYRNYGNWNFGPVSMIYDATELINGSNIYDYFDTEKTILKAVDENNYVKLNAHNIDYDGDSLIDIVLSSKSGFNIYKNHSPNKNHSPSIPQNLEAYSIEDTVALTWDKSTDPNNKNSGLFYNVQIWNKETGKHITPIHSQKDGHLLLPNKYTTNTNKYILRSLPYGIYEWKVQAIDPTHLPSQFSSTGSFVVNFRPKIVELSDTSCNNTIENIVFDPPSEHYQWNIEGGEIIDSSSQTQLKVRWNKKGKHTITLTNTKLKLSTKDSTIVLSNPIPIISAKFLNKEVPLEGTFTIDTTQLSNYKNINWSIENVSYTTSSLKHIFSLQGKQYTVSLVIDFENKCQIPKDTLIDLYSSRIIGDNIICGDSTVNYTAEPSNTNFSYLWDIKGGTIIQDNGTSITVKWSPEVTTTQYIKVTNKNLNQTDSIIVQVNEQPIADFELPENISRNAWIDFTNTSYKADSYLWNFDELDNSSIEEHPSVLFNNIGQHTISLTAFTDKGCQNKHEKFISVSDNLAPIRISNFLTPNNDGANDILKVTNIERYPENTLIVYNAWGQEIFRQEAYDNTWTLKIDGEYIPSGQYLCKIKLKAFNQEFEQIITVLK